jgi:hypothetical protein
MTRVTMPDRGDRTAKANAALTARANARAAKVAPIIAEMRATGVTSAYGIALALNGRGIRTATGKRKWEAVQVRPAGHTQVKKSKRTMVALFGRGTVLNVAKGVHR